MSHGPSYRAHGPDGHVFEIYFETRKYQAPDALKPALKNQAQRFPARGMSVRRLDHLNLLCSRSSRHATSCATSSACG